ncbi:hypothetical protein [Flavimarina sp. Hel_I_48]|uniref:hypothetical protein n=1 Tax=Flavimarina sp. Hel_I_48 TaxID=1392488 RepID=UPI0004DEF983|nr:hypothetical protein [Flavimarina sp. Hel_I_48]
MKKDIEIPKVSDVYIAARKTFNEEHLQEEWNVYLINAKEDPLEIVLIVAKGHGDSKKTSTMRHKLDLLPGKSFAKIEFIEDSLLALNNEFAVTFFLNGTLYERTFIFPANSINEKNLSILPVMGDPGILAE